MSNSPTPPPLADVWSIINREDWLSPDFSRAKAYVCAVFAELAYWHIPVSELAGHDRVKVVPSSAYQELARRVVADDALVRLLAGADFASFTIARRHAVVVAVPTPRVIFVAIRGTAYLYDWLTNLDLRKLDDPGGGTGRFHDGFYRALEECFEPLFEKLRQYHRVPVYVSGHSLGGAMAALLHATRGAAGPMNALSHANSSTHSAYTFGMPRYADEEGVRSHRCPHHILKNEDIVPRVPPLWLGYANSALEYGISGARIERTPTRETAPFVTWTWRLATKVAIKQHFIEGYRRALVS